MACCLVAFAGTAPMATADQGKGTGHAKQTQKQDNKNKDKDKEKGSKGTKGADNDRPDQGRRDDGGRSDSSQMRFAGMDRDNNGVITRTEWSGNDTSFANHDWDGNGVLSGNEVRPGATRPGRNTEDTRLDRWDINRDGMLSRSEWRGTAEAFSRLDINRDGVLSRNELPPSVR